jgi:hypothetical protein
MNRKERRNTSKKLGIMQYQRNLPLKKKMSLMRENIIAGNKIHEEFIRRSKLTQEELQAELEAQRLYERAAIIANEEHIPFTDAVEKAKTLIYEETKHLEET